MTNLTSNTCTRLIRAMSNMRNHWRSLDSLSSSAANSEIERIKLLTSLGESATLFASKPTIIKAAAYKKNKKWRNQSSSHLKLWSGMIIFYSILAPMQPPLSCTRTQYMKWSKQIVRSTCIYYKKYTFDTHYTTNH